MASIDTIYFIHHSHTDIGYTHDQPIVWDLHARFIDDALACAAASAAQEGDSAFRWTVETTDVLRHWLSQASPAQRDRFVELERAGRIEVTGMLANITPLYDLDQLIESLQPIAQLRDEYGFTIRHAMNCDVNGQNWPLVDALLDAGIEGFTMAINTHFGGAPFLRPNTFWWQGPSGRKLLAYNGWPYDTGWRYGIGRDAEDFENVWWPRVARYLDEGDYPLSSIMIQSYHPFGDNGSAFAEFSNFIERWNAAGKTPRIKFATPAMWWAAVRTEAERLPTHRGDWTDYWNFGCGSSAREQTLNRASRQRLRVADALAAVSPDDADLARAVELHRADAWRNLHFWDEHTWGADASIRAPYLNDTVVQWHHKAQYAYQAHSLSLLLQRDGLAALARQVAATGTDNLLLFNPLPWPRQISGSVGPNVATPRGTPDDATASRHFQDHVSDLDTVAATTAARETEFSNNQTVQDFYALAPTEVPGFGYKVVRSDELIKLNDVLTPVAEAGAAPAVVENHRHRLEFDLERGGIRSWYDKKLDVEWVDPDAGYPLHGFVHEEVADRTHEYPRHLLFKMLWDDTQIERSDGWKPDWEAQRQAPTKVFSHQVYATPLGVYVIQTLEAPGCASLLTQRVFLPVYDDYIECESSWEMGLDTHPEANYLLFPCNLPDAIARMDLGGQALVAGEEQLPGVCRDYFTVQQWVDFNDGARGMTIATPDNPMVQFGDFHFAQHQMTFALERAMLLGWVTNNYWETNFRAHQPGQVQARYRLLPYAGDFDEARTHRFGLDAANAQPLLQHLGEAKAATPQLATEGPLLNLPGSDGVDSPVLTLHVKPVRGAAGVIVRLLNASDQEQTARLTSGQLRIAGARRCTLLEEPGQELALDNGAVEVTLGPRAVAVVQLTVA